jgi:RNA polymerase sigma-70 factor (ECF subfamily)
VLLVSEPRVGQHEHLSSPPDWESLYAEFSPALLRFLVRLVGEQEGAADVLQDTFMKAMRARVVPPDITGRRAWLFRIASNAGVDVLRRRRRLRLLPRAHTTGPTIDAAGERDHIARTLASLRAEHAAVLLLRTQEGYSCAEIARMCGISERAAKARLARARLSFVAAYDRIERGPGR